MKRLIIASLFAGACVHGAATAQEFAPLVMDWHEFLAANEDPRAQSDAWKRWADEYSREMRTSMGSLFANRVVSHRLVKGAPYSARVVTEMNQALADGNVISHKHESAVYRDSEGRTRQEMLNDGKRASIVIDDPVEHKHYVLMPDTKRAIEVTARVREPKVKNKQVVKVDGREIRIEDGSIFVDGKEANETVIVKANNGKEVRVENGKVTIDGKDVADVAQQGQRHVVVKTMTLPKGTREEVRVEIVNPGDTFDLAPPAPSDPAVPPARAPKPPKPPKAPKEGALAPLPPMPPFPAMPGLQTMRFENVGRLGKGVTTSLAPKEFDGVKAEGKQTTWTIPAGEIGNRGPISVTSETWYSPELQVTVYSRYNDPRTGESIYRLAGIKRGEPSADLFRVPADYQVRSRAR